MWIDLFPGNVGIKFIERVGAGITDNDYDQKHEIEQNEQQCRIESHQRHGLVVVGDLYQPNVHNDIAQMIAGATNRSKEDPSGSPTQTMPCRAGFSIRLNCMY